jgi:hypothetical protein
MEMAAARGFPGGQKITASPLLKNREKPRKPCYKSNSMVYKKNFFSRKKQRFLLTKSNFYTIIYMLLKPTNKFVRTFKKVVSKIFSKNMIMLRKNSLIIGEKKHEDQQPSQKTKIIKKNNRSPRP